MSVKMHPEKQYVWWENKTDLTANALCDTFSQTLTVSTGGFTVYNTGVTCSVIYRITAFFGGASFLKKKTFHVFYFVIIIDCKWIYTRWQWWYNKTQPQNNTHHTT
jgi:hypothetical protein